MADEARMDLPQDRTTLHTLCAPPAGAFSIVDVPRLSYAIIDGDGPPEQITIQVAVKVLYTAIYAIRRESRERMGKRCVEAPVETLYRADDTRDLAAGNREKRHWHVQIALPVWADAQKLKASAAEARHELGDDPAVRWEALAEGKCVQSLHVGQAKDLPKILAGLSGDDLPQQGPEPVGPCHEIHLDDWSRVAPPQRKIIVRQPVRPTTPGIDRRKPTGQSCLT